MMQLKNGSIHVWHTKLSLRSKNYSLFESWLTSEEKIRVEKLKLLYRRRFILTRGILRTLLSGYSGQSPEKIRFSYTELGKPLFINPLLNKPIEFNLSHSHERVAFAFAMDTPIGIDLEYKTQRKYIDKIAYRFFSAQDYEKIKSLTGRNKLNAFFNAWVRIEALSKALGHHLHTHPYSKYKDKSPKPKELTPYTLFSLAFHPDFSAALAIKGNNKLIEVKECGYLLNSINIKRTTPQMASSACISVKG